MNRIKIIGILIMLPLMSTIVQAQKTDTLALFREFIDKCNGYKQLPLYMEVDCRRQSNLPLTNEDTANTRAVFNIQTGGAYIRFGPIEQIVNDSVVLTIMENVKQMVVSESGNKVTDLMRMMTGPALADTSARKMADKYMGTVKDLGKDQRMIRIYSRKIIPGSAEPQEEVIMVYNSKTGIPESITTIKRALAPDQKYESIDQAKLALVKKVSLNGKDSLLVRESKAIYDYHVVSHEARKLPVVLSDRVEINEERNFIPVKSYSEYSLIIN